MHFWVVDLLEKSSSFPDTGVEPPAQGLAKASAWRSQRGASQPSQEARDGGQSWGWLCRPEDSGSSQDVCSL